MQDFDPGNGLHLADVGGDDAASSLLRADTLCGDLAPAAGRRAEIEDRHARLQELVLVSDLDELESRARAIALALGFLDIRIVELALQPAR